MKRKIAGGIAGIIAFVLAGQTGAVNMVYANSTDTLVESSTEQQSEEAVKVQELTDYSPRALPVKIGAKVVDKDISTSGITALSGDSCVVSSKSSFIKKLHKYMTARKTTFTITYKGPYTDIYNAATWKNLFYKAWNIDDKNTSDDFDYLYGCVNTYGLKVLSYSKNKSVFKISVTYRESAAKLKKVNKKVKSVLKSLNLSGKSRVAKVKAFQDYIAKKISYDNSLSKFTAYDGLVSSEHSTVCQGYANLFYKMCTDSGIPCRIMTGSAPMPHAWNLVKIGKKWYHVDTTWDDTDMASSPVKYDYFLAGSKTMKKDHTLDSTFCTTSFKKKYPIASADYEWEVALTSKSTYKKKLDSAIKQQLNYTALDDANKLSIDLFRKAMKETVNAMSATKYKAYVKGGDTKIKDFIQTGKVKWYNKMEQPMNDYLESDTFLQEREAYLLSLYTEEQLSNMSDEERKAATYDAGYAVYKTKFNQLYKENKSGFIDLMLTM